MGIGSRTGALWRPALLLAIGAAGGAAAVAVATVPDSSGVIHACVKLSGSLPDTSASNLTVIDPSAGQSCSNPVGTPPTQTPLSWNVTGPQGPPGGPNAGGQTVTANTYTITLAPPAIRAGQKPFSRLTLGTGRGAYRFDILSYAFAVTQTGGHGAGGGKTHGGEISVTKRLDKSSAKLLELAARGTHFKQGTIAVRKTAGGKTTLLTITLQNPLISGFRDSSSPENHTIVETLTLSYSGESIKLAK